MTYFVVVPQWQGSGSARAMRLRDGADIIRGDLPAAKTLLVDVPLGVGDRQGSGVHGLTALQLIAKQTTAALESLGENALVIGGDCGVELAAIPHALRKTQGSMAVLWLDAHPDLNTVQSSPSGAFHGMVLRTLLGEGLLALLPDRPLQTKDLVLAGTRALDEPEAAFVESAGIRVLAPDALTVESLLDALTATGARSVYVHIDLDVLDPGEFAGISYPEPFGVSVAGLLELIRAVKERFPLAGAAVTEFAPASPEQAADDLPTILRILGALNS
ncbi:arginase family protein [Parafrigoribacterium mesophilum]|uniref:arginase family protein n=1 Tax=Parafrigoribacterium mesophilum TaxID=433646 RepID=UPI0031FC9CC0